MRQAARKKSGKLTDNAKQLLPLISNVIMIYDTEKIIYVGERGGVGKDLNSIKNMFFGLLQLVRVFLY